MKLVIAIVQSNAVNNVIAGLMEENIRATKLASTGGFLKSGNTTLLIGVEDQELDKLVRVIDENSQSRKVESDKGTVTVDGANLFVIDMDKYLRI